MLNIMLDDQVGSVHVISSRLLLLRILGTRTRVLFAYRGSFGLEARGKNAHRGLFLVKPRDVPADLLMQHGGMIAAGAHQSRTFKTNRAFQRIRCPTTINQIIEPSQKNVVYKQLQKHP